MRGPEESDLRGRVVFVEGAPRSGTSFLTVLLLTHPEIAGTGTETHLFDIGVDRLFENHEDSIPHHAYLAGYLSRKQLVDAVRELGDFVLTGGGKPQTAKYVLEKTPTVPPNAELPLARKLECYPDAWYVHIVRDGDNVARSAMAAGWYPTRSAAQEAWRESVEAIRRVLSGHERYREVRYEELVQDPAGVTSKTFEWLELPVDEELPQQVEEVARQRVAQLPRRDSPRNGPPPERQAVPALDSRGRRHTAREWIPRLRRRLTRRGSRNAGHRVRERPLTARFITALQERSREELEAIVSPAVEVTLRTGSGDTDAQGKPAVDLLIAVGAEIWSLPFIWQSGAASSEGSFQTVLVSGLRTGAQRVDVSFALLVTDELVSRVVILSAGDLQGRPAQEWRKSDSERSSLTVGSD